MKTNRSLILAIKSIAENYDIDPAGTCNSIDNELQSAGYRKCGGEMARVDRWEKDGFSPIYVSYDPEHSHISIN